MLHVIKKNNKSITAYRKQFYNLYQNSIREKLAEFEVERRRKLSEVIFYFVIGVITLLVLWLVFLLVLSLCRTFPILLFFILPLFCMFMYFSIFCISLPAQFFASAKKKFAANLKARCMRRIVTAFDNLRWYDGIPLITDDEIRESQLLQEFSHRWNFDSFVGVYNNIPFIINETYVGEFKGVLIKFKANKTIKNTTIVANKYDIGIKNNDVYFVFTILGMILCFILAFADISLFEKCKYFMTGIPCLVLVMLKMITKEKKEVLSEMKLEDPEFNKKHKAYSSSQIEGRYLITPAFMERFNNLQTAFGATFIKCSFYKDNIMFAITTSKNLFEIGDLTRSLNDPKQMEEFFNELTSILEMTDYLKLDEKTGL